MNVYAKFCCAPLCIKKALGIFREMIPRTRRRTTRVAFWDPPSGSKNTDQWPTKSAIHSQNRKLSEKLETKLACNSEVNVLRPYKAQVCSAPYTNQQTDVILKL